MQILINLLKSYAVFTGLVVTAWSVGFMVLIPFMRIQMEDENVQKAIAIGITLVLTASCLLLYFYLLWQLLRVTLWPFLFYSITPIITVLLLIYVVIVNLRLGW